MCCVGVCFALLFPQRKLCVIKPFLGRISGHVAKMIFLPQSTALLVISSYRSRVRGTEQNSDLLCLLYLKLERVTTPNSATKGMSRSWFRSPGVTLIISVSSSPSHLSLLHLQSGRGSQTLSPHLSQPLCR